MMTFITKHLHKSCFAVVGVVSLICGYLAVTQVMNKKQHLGIEKDILFKRMKEVNLASTNLEELKTTLAVTKKELDYLNERIPETGKIGLLLKQIDALMKQRKITLISLKPMPVQGEKIYLKNPIQLKCQGDFADIYHLIHDLERMNRILVMEKMTIVKQEDMDPCRVELMISVFERKKTFDILGIS